MPTPIRRAALALLPLAVILAVLVPAVARADEPPTPMSCEEELEFWKTQSAHWKNQTAYWRDQAGAYQELHASYVAAFESTHVLLLTWQTKAVAQDQQITRLKDTVARLRERLRARATP